ncbi:MAG TPA: DUF2065 domain-containing protein [Gammaproteobacteria bacterium]|nr:DUF2065 domain-containing protein [Gammaproteobacteria bacterium]
MWQDLLTAAALVLVIEGILPFANPEGYRRALQLMVEQEDRVLRIGGLVSMLLGAVLVFLIRN